MQRLHILLKIFNTIFPFFDTLYILQLEEYSSQRLLRWLPRFYFRRNIQKRQQLVITQRVVLELVISFILFGFIIAFGAYWLWNFPLLFLLFLLLTPLLVPFCVLAANEIVAIYQEPNKKKIRLAAAQKVKRSGAKVVAIAGSYGKTTVKNFVFQLAKHLYKTQMIPGNINTPLGIAIWINKNLLDTTELLISEVDAYEIGEIAKSCDILDADIAVLTNVGDQHVERFGNTEKLAHALSEVFTHSKTDAQRICTDNTKSKISSFIPDPFMTIEPESVNSPKYQGKSITLPNLSDSNTINLMFALRVAEQLSITYAFVADTIKHLELPERRQQETDVLGFEGIDDSYNISFTTAQAGILTAKKLATQKSKKLLVITAGIPELSKDNQDKNQRLGTYLSLNADHTIILGSIFAHEILSGFNTKNVTVTPTLIHAITEVLPEYDKSDWFLLLQPELNDLYY